MKTRLRKLWLGAGALVIGTMLAAGLAIPAGVFADAAPLAMGVGGLVAPAPVYVSDRPNYTGYATVSIGANMACAAIYPSNCNQVAAWQWYSGYGWYRRSHYSGTRVWTVPYGSGWSWTWTSQTGWLAMRSNKLLISQSLPPLVVT